MSDLDKFCNMHTTNKLTTEQKLELSKKIKTRVRSHCGKEFIWSGLEAWSYKFVNLKGKKIVTCSNSCHNMEVCKNENNRYRK